MTKKITVNTTKARKHLASVGLQAENVYQIAAGKIDAKNLSLIGSKEPLVRQRKTILANLEKLKKLPYVLFAEPFFGINNVTGVEIDYDLSRHLHLE